MTTLIEFTPAAVSKLKEILADQNMEDSFLRISAHPTAQGGVEYDFGISQEANSKDETQDGDIKAVIDTDSVDLLRGSKVDYIETLERSGFTVENPNVKSGCACGGGGCCN